MSSEVYFGSLVCYKTITIYGILQQIKFNEPDSIYSSLISNLHAGGQSPSVYY